jgi:hypothetical protein
MNNPEVTMHEIRISNRFEPLEFNRRRRACRDVQCPDTCEEET